MSYKSVKEYWYEKCKQAVILFDAGAGYGLRLPAEPPSGYRLPVRDALYDPGPGAADAQSV